MRRTSWVLGMLSLFATTAMWMPSASAHTLRSSGRAALHPGVLVRFQGAGVYVPARGHFVENFLLTTHGEYGLVVSTDMRGGVHVRHLSPITSPVPNVTSPPACSDSFRPGVYLGHWVSPFDWYFNVSSTPSRNTVANVETDLRSAVQHITNENNNCSPHRPDTISATAAYQGRNARGENVNSDGTCQDSTDNVNEIGFGKLTDGAIADTCNYGGKTVLGESDVLMNNSNTLWTTDEATSCSGEYNVDDIITHERGHSFGLADVKTAGHANLTMWYTSGHCETSKETLGLGDMLELESLY